MYPEIKPAQGMPVLRQYFDCFNHELPEEYPVELMMRATEFIMHDNIIKFGDTYWRQTEGTVMGAHPAPPYCNIIYGYHERVTILPKYKLNLLHYSRIINDTLCAFNDRGEDGRLQEFLNDLSFYDLVFTTTTPGDTVDFMDLTVKLNKNGKVTTTKFYKPCNLFL